MTELIDRFHTRIRERVRPLNDAPAHPNRAFVLCWLHHAIRDHENPALDAALTLGAHLDRPVLVYQGLGGRHRYNSDRSHAFIMQGARDLQAGLARRSIASAFHLPRVPEATGPLAGLVAQACAFVTEDFPAPPFPAWSARHAQRADCLTIAVDAACLAPMDAIKTRHTRAFRFRDAAKRLWAERIRDPWMDVEPTTDPLHLTDVALGFEPVDLAAASIPALCAACDIDHAIPPVGRIDGGTRAGYARWEAFKVDGLRQYDRRRNDAAAMDAVSGLSPWLHHGHVSPFRIAREATEIGGAGADKFLDELLTWRELAFNFCARTPSDALETIAAIPEWAVQTLREHADDPRDAIYAWETLARAGADDELWNAAQRSLLLNGELHNNIRMTWGKMIVAWKTSPDAALRDLIDLNHRFALDGCNPNSYGGLLWCLGQFDRPFSPESPVFGAVRARSTRAHAERLEPRRYAAAVRERIAWRPMRIAVIGAGVSGLACARTLHDQACDVTVFDRGRGPGGRMATRHVTRDDFICDFDHGAPCFHVTDPRFGRYVRSWLADGVCRRWDIEEAVLEGGVLRPATSDGPTLIGTPGMNAVCRHLAADLNVRYNAPVQRMRRDADGWRLDVGDDQESDAFDAVVIGAPLTQATRIAGEHAPLIADAAADFENEANWIAMLVLTADLADLPGLIENTDGDALRLIVRDDARPDRPAEVGTSRLVVHAHPAWSAARYDADRAEIASLLATETLRLLSAATDRALDQSALRYAAAHRWGLARPKRPRPEACLCDAEARIAVCGDAFREASVEGAFLSGCAAAGRILALRESNDPRAAEQPSLFGETT